MDGKFNLLSLRSPLLISMEMEVVTFAKEVPEYVPDIAPLHEHHNPPGITHISQSVNSPFYFPQIKCENACAFV